GATVEIAGGFEHLIGPIMHRNRAKRRLAVEPAHIAVGLVETHQAMHRGDGRERRLDCSFRRIKRSSCDRNLDECAEQRTCAANARARPGRACPGHPRLPPPSPPPQPGEGREGDARKTWMPAKTGSPPRDAAGRLCAGITVER